jgi:hypothetical protein
MPTMKHVDQTLAGIVPAQATASRQVRSNERTPPKSAAGGRDHVDAINQVFAELALAYHNQFHKAFAEEGALTLAKKYWHGVLVEYSPEVILRAVRHVVRSSEYLPTLAAIVQACESAHDLFGLPTAQAAYVEACCAPEPKSQYAWSHPAVFLAAQQTGWHALASETQVQVFPLFEYNYSQFCHRVMTGEQLELPVRAALPETVAAPLSAEDNLKRLAQLRKQFDI